MTFTTRKKTTSPAGDTTRAPPESQKPRGRRWSKADRELYRLTYVTSIEKITLDGISSLTGSPSMTTLERWSAEESWPEQRQEFWRKIGGLSQEIVAQQQATRQARSIERRQSLGAAFQVVGGMALDHLKQKAHQLSPFEASNLVRTGLMVEQSTETKYTKEEIEKRVREHLMGLAMDVIEVLSGEVTLSEDKASELYGAINAKWYKRKFEI